MLFNIFGPIGFSKTLQLNWVDSLSLPLKTSEKKFDNLKSITVFLNEKKVDAYSKGYLDFSIDSLTPINDSSYFAWIHQGRRYIWGNIKWGIKEGVLLKSGLNPKKIENQAVNPTSLFLLYEKIIGYYENNGYPFASVNLDSTNYINDTISGKLNIVLGSHFTFDTLAIHGDSKLKKSYLQHYLEILPGNNFNDNLIVSIGKKLKELPFATEFQSHNIEFVGNKVIVHVYLNKKTANFFNGVLGILPNSPSLQQNTGSNLLITGDVKLTLLNSFKYGEKIDFSWRRLQALTQQLNADVAFPYLFNTPFGASNQLDLLKQDTSFINFSNSLGIAYSLSTNKQLKVFWEHKSTTVLNQNTNSLQNLYSNNTNFYGLAFSWEKLDYRFNPTSGVRLFVSAQGGNKTMQGTEEKGKIKVPIVSENLNLSITALLPKTTAIYHFKAEIDYYIPLFKITTLKLSTKNAYISNPYLFDNDLFRVGGFRLLRGFDEQSLYASFYSIATIEYRLLLEQNSFIALFFDKAYTERKTFSVSESDRPYGFGASINFQTKPGIFSVSYALGSQKGNPINFQSAKIHLGFVSLF